MRFGKTIRYAGVVTAAIAATVAGLVAVAQAQAPVPLKIGVMEGFSGVYGDLTQGEVEAMQMAIDDFGGKVLGRPIEILQADHQTKPDVGAAIARKWYDVDGVKMITGIGTKQAIQFILRWLTIIIFGFVIGAQLKFGANTTLRTDSSGIIRCVLGYRKWKSFRLRNGLIPGFVGIAQEWIAFGIIFFYTG